MTPPQKAGTRVVTREGFEETTLQGTATFGGVTVDQGAPAVRKAWGPVSQTQDINSPFTVPHVDEDTSFWAELGEGLSTIVTFFYDSPATIVEKFIVAVDHFRNGKFLEGIAATADGILSVVDYVDLFSVGAKGVRKLINAADNIADAGKLTSKVSKILNVGGDTAKGANSLDNMHDASRAADLTEAARNSCNGWVRENGQKLVEEGLIRSIDDIPTCFVGETFVLASGGHSLAALPVIAVSVEPSLVVADASQAWDREKILRGLVVVAFAYGAMHAVNRRRKRPMSASGELSTIAREKCFSALGRGTLRIDDPRLDDIAEPPGMLPRVWPQPLITSPAPQRHTLSASRPRLSALPYRIHRWLMTCSLTIPPGNRCRSTSRATLWAESPARRRHGSTPTMKLLAASSASRRSVSGSGSLGPTRFASRPSSSSPIRKHGGTSA